MKIKNVMIIVILFVAPLLSTQSLVPFASVVFGFPDAKKAKEILLQDDLYLTHLSSFDLCAKVQKAGAVTLAQFKDFLGKQTLGWTKAEKSVIEKIIAGVKGDFAFAKLVFPQKIYLVKTTGKEEGNAAYCRNLDTIVFPVDYLKYDEGVLKEILVHEMFHIFSRNNPEIREKLYNSLGFMKTGELTLPPVLSKLVITNPDAVLYDYYFDTEYRGEALPVMPVLLAKTEYNPKQSKNFFEYLTLRFMAIDVVEGIAQLKVVDGDYLILWLIDIPDFYEKVGSNTDYILGVEEILADNFQFMIMGKEELPSPLIIQQIRSILE